MPSAESGGPAFWRELWRIRFRVEVKEDGVFARIEGYEEEIMKEKLKILGYLIIHTRQLDMVMSNDFSYNQQRTKLMGEIRMILQGKSAPGGRPTQICKLLFMVDSPASSPLPPNAGGREGGFNKKGMP